MLHSSVLSLFSARQYHHLRFIFSSIFSLNPTQSFSTKHRILEHSKNIVLLNRLKTRKPHNCSYGSNSLDLIPVLQLNWLFFIFTAACGVKQLNQDNMFSKHSHLAKQLNICMCSKWPINSHKHAKITKICFFTATNMTAFVLEDLYKDI